MLPIPFHILSLTLIHAYVHSFIYIKKTFVSSPKLSEIIIISSSLKLKLIKPCQTKNLDWDKVTSNY